jgi:hypothetical protein
LLAFVSLQPLKFARSLFLIIVLFVLTGSCQKETGDQPSADSRVTMSKTFTGLDANTTYYWKITASGEDQTCLTTHTPVQSFTTTGS